MKVTLVLFRNKIPVAIQFWANTISASFISTSFVLRFLRRERNLEEHVNRAQHDFCKQMKSEMIDLTREREKECKRVESKDRTSDNF